VIRHHHVSHDYEAVALASFLEDLEEEVAAARRSQPRLSVIAGASNEVEMVLAVVALEAFRHVLTVRLGAVQGLKKSIARAFAFRVWECPPFAKDAKDEPPWLGALYSLISMPSAAARTLG
jgi:hypothetical protein